MIPGRRCSIGEKPVRSSHQKGGEQMSYNGTPQLSAPSAHIQFHYGLFLHSCLHFGSPSPPHTVPHPPLPLRLPGAAEPGRMLSDALPASYWGLSGHPFRHQICLLPDSEFPARRVCPCDAPALQHEKSTKPSADLPPPDREAAARLPNPQCHRRS